MQNEVDKLELAVRELERAELYVVSAINVDLADAARRRRLEDLRADIAVTRQELRTPRPVPLSR